VNDSVLNDRIQSRRPTPTLLPEDDPDSYDDLGGFGILRGTKERAVMLDFRFKTGERSFCIRDVGARLVQSFRRLAASVHGNGGETHGKASLRAHDEWPALGGSSAPASCFVDCRGRRGPGLDAFGECAFGDGHSVTLSQGCGVAWPHNPFWGWSAVAVGVCHRGDLRGRGPCEDTSDRLAALSLGGMLEPEEALERAVGFLPT
jgi:hypothetical protein